MKAELHEGPCPAEETLASFAEGGLQRARREPVEAHIDRCAACRRVIGHLVALRGPAARSARLQPEASGGSSELYADRVSESAVWGSGSRIAGRYVLSRTLGRGGMGTVWLARDERLLRDVAVKVLRLQMLGSESMMARFRREATAIARLRSTHIVEVYDYGVDEGSPYIVMELLEGEDLGARISRQGRLPLEQVASIVAQAAKALTEAHAAGIVHRDLKPANVFLCSRRDGEIVKIIDFGVAKALGPAKTFDGDSTSGEGLLIGTPRFMSPEQLATPGEVDHRADSWSLAVIAHFAFTGRAPFPGDVAEAIAAILRGEHVHPSEQVDDCPAALDAFFDRALATKPDDRHATALEMAAALGDIVGGSGDTAREPAADSEAPRAARATPAESRRGLYAFVVAVTLATAVWASRGLSGSPPSAATSFSAAQTEPISPSASAVATTPAPLSTATPSESAVAVPSAAPQPAPSKPRAARPGGTALFSGPW